MQKLYLYYALCLTIMSGIAQADPRDIRQARVIDLLEDIVHIGKDSPFIATETFGAYGPEKLVITSKVGKSVIIREGSTWDFSSFSGPNRIIEFAGNARLICEPGSRLNGAGGVLRFVDDARFIIGKE